MGLGNDYYLVKFLQPKNYSQIMSEGSWFVGSQYLTVHNWEPKFKPQQQTNNYSTIWIRLQDLPTEYYDSHILQKISFIGSLIKIDACIAQTTRGRYARLCILAQLNTPLPNKS